MILVYNDIAFSPVARPPGPGPPESGAAAGGRRPAAWPTIYIYIYIYTYIIIIIIIIIIRITITTIMSPSYDMISGFVIM